KQIRVTVMLLLLISNLVRLLISIPVQLFSPLALKTIGVALPGFLLALFLGPKIFKSVSDEFYVKFIDFILILSCMTLIWKLLYA
ncbi:MAG: hypothetical protein KDD62_05070, partial [Bdellovibrionales bacterium]|nr:hypothetical protein [Bdellovibrionales bacterium]